MRTGPGGASRACVSLALAPVPRAHRCSPGRACPSASLLAPWTPPGAWGLCPPPAQLLQGLAGRSTCLPVTAWELGFPPCTSTPPWAVPRPTQPLLTPQHKEKGALEDRTGEGWPGVQQAPEASSQACFVRSLYWELKTMSAVGIGPGECHGGASHVDLPPGVTAAAAPRACCMSLPCRTGLFTRKTSRPSRPQGRSS